MPKKEVVPYLEWKRLHPKKKKSPPQVEKPRTKIPRSFHGHPPYPSLKKYGLTVSDYDRMILQQNHTCIICLNNGVRLIVDHNHHTGNVRSLLCANCNSLLGFAQESIPILHRAIAYLIYHSRQEVSGSQPGDF